MKIMYLDCAMGAAGDMLMGALLALHPDPEAVLRRLNAALPERVRVTAAPDEKRGIRGTHVHVAVDGEEEGQEDGRHQHPHTSVSEIREQIRGLSLPEAARRDMEAVFDRIAQAESQVHGRSVENIHLHEVGSLDALADVAGVCLLMHELAPDRVMASTVSVGSGTVRCAHGLLPVPAPATELLLRGIPIRAGSAEGELCTPTGAALLAHFVDEFGPLPTVRLVKSGYGTGTRDFPSPNVLRALWGETEAIETILALSCNLDDMTAEAVGFCMERLLEAGALDVYTVPIGMKKNRPGILLNCLCRPEQREDVLHCLFTHTTTLGVRETSCDRYTLQRSFRTVDTEAGPVQIKTAGGWGVTRSKAEYEDLARIARDKGISLKAAEEMVRRAE